ncbi:MAG: hypothetical protein AAFV80_20440, partial [Bacteroidota bacterium]
SKIRDAYQKRKLEIEKELKSWDATVESIENILPVLEACRKLVPLIATPIISVVTHSERLKLVNAKLEQIETYLLDAAKAEKLIKVKIPSLVTSNQYVLKLKAEYLEQKATHQKLLGKPLGATKLDQVHEELSKAIQEFNTAIKKTINSRKDIDQLFKYRTNIQFLIEEWNDQLALNGHPEEARILNLKIRVQEVQYDLLELEHYVHHQAIKFALAEFERAAKLDQAHQELTMDTIDQAYQKQNTFWEAYDEYQRQTSFFKSIPPELEEAEIKIQQLRIQAAQLETAIEHYRIAAKQVNLYQSQLPSIEHNFEERLERLDRIDAQILQFQNILN